MSDIQILPFTTGHLESAVALSRNEGWPHRAEDWALVAEISKAFVAAEGGRVVGTAFCTPFGSDLAMLDMIIVDGAMRGRGLGRRLVERVMAEAGDRSLRLVATEAGLPLYAKLGFVEDEQILQHQGEAAAVLRPQGVTEVASDDWPAIVELDRTAFGGDRTLLFEHLQAVGEAVVMRGEAGRIAGFAICRPFGRGFVVGPVVAPDAEAAKRLIAAYLHRHAGSFVRVDVPASSGLAPWLAENGLAHVGGGMKMASPVPRSAPSSNVVQTFALASQALG
ncbi:GNAT family N-acetyltransferase [Aurantimonas sp. VKM B-3413]|uniref:GNAT family N-acetyltransferase n=1 Tax=Aurantimonas sp. VKM B-3413 TaxID=2779401 RepID=UPI001E5C4494|nr:GNAT family N-acetyltransferase [Aurantimonas sp. VKM B-3413]MCB8840355.1 GNAT family N-acetyltransferase [Aurantimonas sp. VKM B-3413]